MEYLVSFLEGVITFVSPCLLPMIPIYVTSFAAGEEESSRTALNVVCGAVVVLFGLYFLGFIKLNLFRGPKVSMQGKRLGFPSALLFGIVFSIGWTPCVGAFLGSALLLASQQGSAVVGVAMLLCYSAGLGVPFVASALLIDRLKGAFDAIKRHYELITKVCGWLLVAIGVLMATGLLGNLLAFLS